MSHAKTYAGLALCLSVLIAPGRSMAEIVFQNNDSAAAGIDHNFGLHEGGDQITLGGNCRAISQLELAIIAAPGPVDLIVRIYANDGPIALFAPAGNEPGTVLFDSGVMTIQATAQFGFNTFVVDLPNVPVPDTFTWTVQRTDGSGLWLRRYGPPSIGTGHDFAWDRWPTYWAPLSFPNNASVPFNHFYAVVHAAGGASTITCPAGATVACGGDTSTAALGTAAAQGCGPVNVTYTDATATGCAGDTITRTWVANDGSATPANCVQLIQVADSTPPTLVGVPAGATVECGAAPPAAAVTAVDDCSADPTITFSEVTSGTCGSSTLTRTWIAADNCGNASLASQVINIADTTPPVASATLTMVRDGDGEGSDHHDDDEGVFVVGASCSDNCDGVAGCGAATLVAELRCAQGGVVQVAAGATVEIELDDEECEIEIEHGEIEIEGDVTLVVTCTDASGNTAQAVAVPVGLSPDNDDEDEDDD